MAFKTTTQWEVRTTGSDTNGGGYDVAAGTTDYSQQTSPQLSLTDVVTIGTTTVTSVTGGFTAAMVGNCINIAGDGIYQIATRSNSNTITVDRSTGTGTGQTGKVGGAFASIGYLMAHMAAQNTGWVKATGTYTLTSTTEAVSGGTGGLSEALGQDGNNNLPTTLSGYTTTRGDGGQATISAGSQTGFNFLNAQCQGSVIENFILDANSQASVGFVNAGPYEGKINNIKCINPGSGAGGVGGRNKVVTDCVVNGVGGVGISASVAMNCFCHNCYYYSTSAAYGCVAYYDTLSGGTYGFYNDDGNTNHNYILVGCVAYNAAIGFFIWPNVNSASPWLCRYCVTVGCSTGFSAYSGHGAGLIELYKCADYNSSTPVDSEVGINTGFITLSGDPFTSISTMDMSLNSGAGASINGIMPNGGAAFKNSGGGGATVHSAGFFV